MEQETGRPNKFFRFFFIFLTAVVLTGCAAPAFNKKAGVNLASYRKIYYVVTQPDPRAVNPRVISRLKETGFNVTVIDPKGPPVDEQGSGFVISPDGYVLTCAHVVENYSNATIWVQGQRYLCTVADCDTNLDLALLKVQGDHPPFHPLAIGFGHRYSLGESVYTMGFPLTQVLGVSPRLDNGLVNAEVGMNDDTNYVQISVPVQPGNSGGPLMTANGQVIGVIVATLNPVNVLEQTGGALPQNVNFAIKLSSVDKFLADSKMTVPTNEAAAGNFDQAEQSVTLVRCGNVSDDDLKEPVLVCACSYFAIFDLYWRFQRIEIHFIDQKTGDDVFVAGQTYDTLVTEDAELDGIFSKISANFFPDGPNPFRGR